jgi:hypothetical protein
MTSPTAPNQRANGGEPDPHDARPSGPVGCSRPVKLVAMPGRTYAENRPYLLPETLGELAGPVTGVIRLPLRLDWSERTEFHLDDLAERNVMYERVIREAIRVDDLRSYINEEVLRQVWGRLFLPVHVRRSWEDRFPDLRLAA